MIAKKTSTNHTNQAFHLITFFSKANVSFDKCLKHLQDKGREKVRISFPGVPVTSIDHVAIESWLNLIVFDGVPVCKVEGNIFRKWIKVNPISAKKVRGIMISLADLVEDTIKAEIE